MKALRFRQRTILDFAQHHRTYHPKSLIFLNQFQQDNVKEYEKELGEIEETKEPEMISFKPE